MLIVEPVPVATVGTIDAPGPATQGRTDDQKQRWCPGAELNHRHTDFQSPYIGKKIKYLSTVSASNLLGRTASFYCQHLTRKAVAGAPDRARQMPEYLVAVSTGSVRIVEDKREDVFVEFRPG